MIIHTVVFVIDTPNSKIVYCQIEQLEDFTKATGQANIDISFIKLSST